MSATTRAAPLRTSWDEKMAAKAEAKLFKEQKAEARAERSSQLAVRLPSETTPHCVCISPASRGGCRPHDD